MLQSLLNVSELFLKSGYYRTSGYHLEMAITNAIRENLGLDPLPVSKSFYTHKHHM